MNTISTLLCCLEEEGDGNLQELIRWVNTTTKGLFGSQELRRIEIQSNNK